MHNLRVSIPKNNLNIDTEARTITDIVSIQLGDIKDWRPWSINQEFLNDLVAAANQQSEGILSNYGHNWNNLGKRLGRKSNYKVVGDKVTSDLKIFEVADISPGNENLGKYVMGLAAEDDKALMSSIVFAEEYFYQETSTGDKIKCFYYDDEQGWISPNPALGSVYPKLKEFKSDDIVDEGAATDSLFSDDTLDIMLQEVMSNKQFPQLLETNWKSYPVLNEFFKDKHGTTVLTQVKSLLGLDKKEIAAEVEGYSKQLEAAQTTITERDATIANLTQERDAAQKTLEALQTSTTNTINSLEDKITKLEGMSAGTHTATGGESLDDEETSTPLYMLDPVTQKAMAMKKSSNPK